MTARHDSPPLWVRRADCVLSGALIATLCILGFALLSDARVEEPGEYSTPARQHAEDCDENRCAAGPCGGAA
jgi:hypothetical protein